MDQKYKKHLKVYSALTTGLALFANQKAEAQVITRDINPNAVLSAESFAYDLDLDNDGNIDFTLNKNTYTYTYNTTTITSMLSIYPSVYNNNIFVNNNNNQALRFDFGTEVKNQTELSYAHLFNANVTNPNTPYLNWGNWESGTTDKYLGVKFKIGTEVHYGWVKMNVSSDFETVTVTEIGYESSPGIPIKAGVTENVPDATNIVSEDVNDNNNVTDLGISFDKASDETNIAGYKVFVVPTAKAASFNYASIATLSADQYVDVAKTGSNIQFICPANLLDSQGDAIAAGTSYTVFVMTVAVGNFNHSLQKSGTEIVLTSPVDAATNLSVSQVAHNGNGADLQVNFDKIAEENTIESYSVVVVPTVDAPAFDLAKAETAIIDANAYNVDVTNANLSVTLSELTKDVNGDLLTYGVSYTVFVVSNHKGTAFTNAISAGSNEITIEPMITGVSATDNTIHVTCFENVVRLSNVNTESDLTLVNSQGVVVYTAKVQKGDSQIELSSLSAGIYLVKVGSQSTKIVLSSK